MNDKIEKAFETLNIRPLDRQETETSLWEQFFKGFVKNFHQYSEYVGAEMGNVTRERKSLKMAKVIAELWADNIINPETVFVSDDETVQKWIDEYCEKNGINFELNDLMEIAFALGTGATVQSRDKQGNVFNQYLNVNSIFPFETELNKIVSCAFVSIEADESIYLQLHQKTGEKYLIINKFFDKEGNEYERDDIEERFESEVKLFQLYSPAIVNNVNVGNPLGISIYANATDELKSVDIAFDALDKEARNGRMRVYVQGEALHMDKGTKSPIFDKDQDEFYVLPEDAKNPEGVLINVQAPTLRIEQYINNLEKQLNLLGSKCGLGDNAFYAKDGTIYTNESQVVSTNSKFYKTRQKHATRIEHSLIEMFKALYYLTFDKLLDKGIHVEFDDSIIHDKEAEYNRALQQFNAGLISRIQFYMDTKGLTREEAIEFNNLQLEEGTQGEDTEEEGGEV